MAAESAAKKAQEHGVQNIEVYVKGPGAGREAALRPCKRQASRLASFGRDPHSSQRLPSAQEAESLGKEVQRGSLYRVSVAVSVVERI